MVKENEKEKYLMERWKNLTPAQVLGFVQGYYWPGFILRDSIQLLSDPDFIKGYRDGGNIARAERTYETSFQVAVGRFERLKQLHRGKIPRLKYRPPEQRYVESVANGFLKKMNNYMPYTLPTREDVCQEAYVGYLLALKEYHPYRGTPDKHLKIAIEGHLSKVYEKANAEKRKSENKKYQLKYIPAYSEGYMETEPELFAEMDLKDDDNIITSQRFKSREYFETYDEQEYREPPRIEHRDGSEYIISFVGSQIFIDTDKKPSEGYKVIEKVGCPLGYGKRHNVWRGLSKPINEFEYISNVLYNRRQKIFYRTPYFKFSISGGVLSGVEKQKLRVNYKTKEPRPLFPIGYLYRERTVKENEFVRGIFWDYQHKKYLKQYLPDDAYRGRDPVFYRGQDPRTIPLDIFKKITLPYQQKYFTRELMKRAGRHYQEPAYIPNFKVLKWEAFDLIQSFPDDQRRFFIMFYDDENIIISRKSIEKRISNALKDDLWIMENPLAGEYIKVLSDEKIIYKTKTLKDAARILKMRNAKMKPLNDDGKEKIRKYFLDRYGVNIVRDTTDKRVKNKSYHFRTNFQVRELLKK